jgi:hypothetical protein
MSTSTPKNLVGGVLQFRITGDGEGGLCAADPVLLPTIFYYGADLYDTRVCWVDDYTEELAVSHRLNHTGYDVSTANIRQIVTDTIDAAFLPESFQ